MIDGHHDRGWWRAKPLLHQTASGFAEPGRGCVLYPCYFTWPTTASPLHATPIFSFLPLPLLSLRHLFIILRPPPSRPLSCHISAVYSSECSPRCPSFSCLVSTLPRRNLSAGDRCHDAPLVRWHLQIYLRLHPFSSSPSIDRVLQINNLPLRPPHFLNPCFPLLPPHISRV